MGILNQLIHTYTVPVGHHLGPSQKKTQTHSEHQPQREVVADLRRV